MHLYHTHLLPPIIFHLYSSLQVPLSLLLCFSLVLCSTEFNHVLLIEHNYGAIGRTLAGVGWGREGATVSPCRILYVSQSSCTAISSMEVKGPTSHSITLVWMPKGHLYKPSIGNCIFYELMTAMSVSYPVDSLSHLSSSHLAPMFFSLLVLLSNTVFLAMGLQVEPPCPTFMWVLGDRTQFLMFVWQALNSCQITFSLHVLNWCVIIMVSWNEVRDT